jgi:hypothetical protein
MALTAEPKTLISLTHYEANSDGNGIGSVDVLEMHLWSS